jgi:hypothetical protein
MAPHLRLIDPDHRQRLKQARPVEGPRVKRLEAQLGEQRADHPLGVLVVTSHEHHWRMGNPQAHPPAARGDRDREPSAWNTDHGRPCHGWGLVGMSWADAPLLTHNGSNGMNLAKVTLDTAKDFGVVAATNIGGPGGDAALNQITEHLFRESGGSAH